MVFASLKSRTELTRWNQQVCVVCTDECLREIDDCVLKGGLAMVICRLLGNVANELCNLNVVLKFFLEGAKHDFALRRFKAIDDGGNRSRHIVFCKLYQFLVDEIMVSYNFFRVVNVRAVNITVYPILSVICTLLVES